MSLLFLVLAMMLVTYLPRLLPLVILGGRRLPKSLRLFLGCIPPAALGALIIPGGLEAVEGSLVLSIAGMAAAIVAAWFVRSLILTVLVSIAAVFVLSSLI